jgi:hypothetical protein
VKKVLKEFEFILTKFDDNIVHLNEFKNFLSNLLKAKRSEADLPLLEIITILRHEKPTLFYVLKKQASGNLPLEMLTSLDGDYSRAKKEIKKLVG